MRHAALPRIRRHRPSPALVVSIIALFVALGGTSYAALRIPKNSVGSPQVINGSLQKADLSAKAAAALKGRTGAQGPHGSPGTNGAVGAAGPTGATGPAGQNGTNATVNGVAAAGDLAGTYPNPTLKDGAVTTAKFGAGALAPNADLLDGLNSTAFLLAGGKAADADLLDGLNSTAFLLAGGKAADSDKLDGIDSTGFVQGGGTRSLYTSGDAFVDTAAGTLILDCASGNFRFRYRSFNGYTLWAADNGNPSRVVETTLPSPDAFPFGNFLTGTRHWNVRAVSNGHIGNWDIMVYGDGASQCEWNILQDVS